MSDSQSILVRIDQKYDDRQRALIGDDIVEFIKDRTRKGLDVHNKPFKAYKKSYVGSLQFRQAGKSADEVNLELSGDMLIGLEVLTHGPGFIKIGLGDGSDNNKAKWNAEKGRYFLGIMPQDLADILSNYPLGEDDTTVAEVGRTFADEFLRSLFK